MTIYYPLEQRNVPSWTNRESPETQSLVEIINSSNIDKLVEKPGEKPIKLTFFFDETLSDGLEGLLSECCGENIWGSDDLSKKDHIDIMIHFCPQNLSLYGNMIKEIVNGIVICMSSILHSRHYLVFCDTNDLYCVSAYKFREAPPSDLSNKPPVVTIHERLQKIVNLNGTLILGPTIKCIKTFGDEFSEKTITQTIQSLDVISGFYGPYNARSAIKKSLDNNSDDLEEKIIQTIQIPESNDYVSIRIFSKLGKAQMNDKQKFKTHSEMIDYLNLHYGEGIIETIFIGDVKTFEYYRTN